MFSQHIYGGKGAKVVQQYTVLQWLLRGERTVNHEWEIVLFFTYDKSFVCFLLFGASCVAQPCKTL